MLDAGLVVIGLGIIAVSYVISEKIENKMLGKKAEDLAQVKDIWTDKDEKRVRERIDSIVEEKVEQAIDKTEDELSRISNEKIMVSNEFSEQVLGKIEQNHEEVVFLYNMLNEKEKQMKTLIKEIDTLKTAVEQRAFEIKENMESPMTVDMLHKTGQESVMYTTPVTVVVEKEDARTVEPLNSNEEKELFQLRAFAESIEAEELERKEKKEPELMTESAFIIEEAAGQPSEKEKVNRNEEILRLYKKGRSVLEISKALNMGQGEVKLIIDLFQGAK